MGASCRRFITTTAVFFIINCIIIATLINLVELTGSFEIRLHRFVEDDCCGPSSSVTFRICVKNYQAFVDVDSPCIIGESVTRPYGRDSFKTLGEAVSFPFNFTWPGSFSFIIEAYQHSETTGEKMLTRFFAQRDLSANQDWHNEHFVKDNGSSLDLSYRVKCETNRYGDQCRIFCKSRNDKFGHYTCDAKEGRKICRPGWKDEYCNKAICRSGCHEVHGFCKEPNECNCRPGWKGEHCDICLPHPGCLHGTCNGAWQCNCNEGWGGLFCTEDLNYCTNHRPCKNGGTCTNTGQGSYTCNCSDLYMGKDCDILKNPCMSNPCHNGGTCSNPSEGNYTCSCVLGFYGPNCRTSASICTHNPCQNGGSCVHHVHHPDGFICQCASGYSGDHCEITSSVCAFDFCHNNGTCIQMTQGIKCQCPLGYSGDRCEIGFFCASSPCLNGGQCLEDAGSFQCRCAPGFTGMLCASRLHNCHPNPCRNGGTCHDLVTHFSCDCVGGFGGRDCALLDLCISSPCRNGGLCKTDAFGVSCLCPEDFRGQFCEYSAVVVPGFPKLINLSIAMVNMSHQVSDGQLSQHQDGSQVVIIVVSTLIGLAVLVTCVACVAIRCCQIHRRKLATRANKAEEDEIKQNERNAVHMNNKCAGALHNKIIVNTLDRMSAKVNNEDAIKIVNEQFGNNKLPEKNVYMQRTLERREKSRSPENSGCPPQDWSPRNSGGVFIIHDHMQPLKSDDFYPTQPPLLRLVDNDKVFATEV